MILGRGSPRTQGLPASQAHWLLLRDHSWGLLQKVPAKGVFLLRCGLLLGGEEYKPAICGVLWFVAFFSDTTTSLFPSRAWRDIWDQRKQKFQEVG